ncbi:MAG: phosphopantetheine-binding protein, partial [Deltaproteobacteria bacterium]|nr:phosphopantetheine-binding protein [Deltaproteobacteria bacterium]
MVNGTILDSLKIMAQNNFNLRAEDLDVDLGLLELGLDSLMIIKLGREIENKYGLNLSPRWFMTSRPTLRVLAQYVAENAPKAQAPASRPEESRPRESGDKAGPKASGGNGHEFREIERAAPVLAAPVSPALSPAPSEPAGSERLELYKLQMETMRELFSAQWQNLGHRPSWPAKPPEPAEGLGSAEAGPDRPGSAEAMPERLSRNLRGFVYEEEELWGPKKKFVEDLV